MKAIEWVAITLGLTLLSWCLIMLIAVWLVLDTLLEMTGSLSMNLEGFGFRRVLESVAITVSTVSMIFFGGCWTFVGLLLGAFWILLAVQELKAHRRMERANEESRAFGGKGVGIGDITCRYNARSSSLRCAINPSGPCAGCKDYKRLIKWEQPR